MTKVWHVNQKVSGKSSKIRRQQIIAALLKNRRLLTKPAQKEFFQPPHPQDLDLKTIGISESQVKKALTRLKQALTQKQLIYIYVDYDADGITATAILWETLDRLGAKVLPFIPLRGDATRGLSVAGITTILKKDKPALIITVDNGIVSFKGARFAKKEGIDLIISDHHVPQKKLPPATAVIHTTLTSGAGVAWFFAREIVKHFLHSGSVTTLELAALGTIADMVPLLSVNRSLAFHGLNDLRQTSRPGLVTLARDAGVNLKTLDDYQVSFLLSPRLNAMGRLHQALDSLRLLCTRDKARAKKLSRDLNSANLNRQDLTRKTFFHALDQAKAQKNQNLIFVSDPSYHDGIVGLVASQLVRSFHRPAVVVAVGESQSKGSARSIKGFNLIKNFQSLSSLFLEVGGHKLAAGFTAETKNLPQIKTRLQKVAAESLTPEQLKPVLEVDCEINLTDVGWQLYREISRFAPFGFDNPMPVFVTRGVKLDRLRQVGKEGKHLQLILSTKHEARNSKLGGIAFGFCQLSASLSLGATVDLAYAIDENVWNNQKSLQLKVKDIIILPRH